MNRRVKKGVKYFLSSLAKPPSFELAKLTSSSSVSSDKCSESIAWPNSRVLLREMSFSFRLTRLPDRLRVVLPSAARRGFFPACRHFRSVVVEPPKIIVVNNTIINVVVMTTRLVSSLEYSRCCLKLRLWSIDSIKSNFAAYQAKGVRNCASQSREPHNERHLWSDSCSAEFVHHVCQWEDVGSTPDKTQNDTPNHKSRFELMLEAEDGQAEIGKHARLANERGGSHRLLHRDLRDSWEIEMTVVRHDDAVEQNRHYAW